MSQKDYRSSLEVLVGAEAASMLLEDYDGSLAKLVLREPSVAYSHPGMHVLDAALTLVKAALAEKMMHGDCVDSPDAMKDWLRVNLVGREYEVFVSIFLDAQNRIVSADEMFRGTISQTSVYPREVVKRALAINAASVIFAHNHPSGVPVASEADRRLTKALREALALVGVKVLDHLIVAGDGVMSFAESFMI